MDKQKINRILATSNTVVDEAVRNIYNLQTGRVVPIKSGIPHLDTIGLGGLFPDTIISIIARSSQGKTYSANTLRNTILSPDNPDVGMLFWNLEMSMLTLLMIEFKKRTRKNLRDIISGVPSQEELQIYKEVADSFRDPRLTKIDESVTPPEFYQITREYIERNLDKKQLFVIIDHIGIIKGTNKTETVYETMELINALKLEYPGKLTFVVLGQLNRDIETRWRNKESNPFVLFPTGSDVFASDALVHYSDILMAQVIPQVVQIEKYGIINRERNPHLEQHIIDEDFGSPKDFVRLKGYNRIYYHFLKVRLQDGEPLIYCDVLDPELEQALEGSAEHLESQNDELIF